MRIDFRSLNLKSLAEFPFLILDIGARGGLKQEWAPLKKYLKVIGFEADASEVERLNQSTGNNSIHYIHSALFDTEASVTLHRTKIDGLSSLYMPNYHFLRYFDQSNIHGYELNGKVILKANPLDKVLDTQSKKGVDFIKVDVEGCAYEVLNGSPETFEESVILGGRVEAEFNPKYSGQHLFPDVDSVLRKYNYELFWMKTCHWKRKAGLQTAGTQGQIIHGDFIYFLNVDCFLERVKNLSRLEQESKVFKFIILCCLYGCFDLAFQIVDQAFGQKILSQAHVTQFKNILAPANHLLMRVPKLRDREAFLEKFAYHAFMLLAGICLERTSFWKYQVVL